jgi:hypothetical protein
MSREMVVELLSVTDYLLVNEHEALDAGRAIGFARRPITTPQPPNLPRPVTSTAS